MKTQPLFFKIAALGLFLLFMGCRNSSGDTNTENSKSESTTTAPENGVKNAVAPQAQAAVEPATVPQGKADGATAGTSIKTLATQYEAEAKGLLQAIRGKQISAEVQKQAVTLTKTGLMMIPLLGKKYPQCTAYFEALVSASSQLTHLSLEAIEKDYHRDGKLPKSPDGACYHGKDLVVHPATVVIMARGGIKTDEQTKSALHEIEEVLAHLVAVVQ